MFLKEDQSSSTDIGATDIGVKEDDANKYD